MTALEPAGEALGARRAVRRPADPLRAPGRREGPPGSRRRAVDALRAPGRQAAPRLQALRRTDLLRVLLVLGVAASVVLHARMALAGAHGPGWSVLMGVMALLCLSCLAGLLRAGDPTGTVRMTMGMALAMALGHVLLLPLLAGGSGAHGAHAHHGGAPAAGAASGAGHGGMLLVVGVELVVAALAVGWTRRHNQRITYQPV